MKVATIIGTRPEIIRLSEVINKLDQYMDHILIHTGQNYDYELNQVFFENLKVRKPNYFLDVDTSSLGKVIGETIIESEEVLIKEKPDAVLILGDTNSSLAAIIAKRLKIPIFHMEAGNRSFDMNVPEEINRRIVDHIADFNLVYTEHARRHLISEGMSHRRIYLTGSPLAEVIAAHEKDINESSILENMGLSPKKYFLFSSHREENVDNPKQLQKILEILESLHTKFDLPIIFSTHPRTRNRLEKMGIDLESFQEKVIFSKPFGYFDYMCLQLNAKCTLSDSGTISEESAILSFPAVSIRNSMERPEAQDAGVIILTGLDKDIVLKSVDITIDQSESKIPFELPEEYKVLNCSDRVLKLIQGNSHLSNKWWGINKTT